jgi:hypothetical protein
VQSIEDVIRRKQRQRSELEAEISTLEAAAKIMEVENGQAAIPNAAANPLATQPPVKRWP